MDNVTFLIPCLNEAKTIGTVISQLVSKYPNTCIIVVDNGSDDGSQEIVRNSAVKLLIAPSRGKANAIRCALQHINTQYVLLLDADNEYSIDSIEYLLRFELNENIMIVGMRSKHNMLIRSKLANYIISRLTYIRSGYYVYDCLTGLRLVPLKLLKQIKSSGFELETELNLIALSNHMNIVSVQIEYQPRTEGKKIKFMDMFKLLKVALIW